MISLALITLLHYLPDAFPWLERPMPGDPHSRTLIIEPVFVVFFCFLVSAWLGCRSRESNSEGDSMVIDRA